MDAMQTFKQIHGEILSIGSQVTVNKKHQYAADWPDIYVVIGISWERRWDRYNVNLAEISDFKDGGCDGWSLDDLNLVRQKTNDRLEREQNKNTELEKDKLRLDWLADRNNSIGNVMLPTKCVEQNPGSLREAIDAAM